MEPYKAYLLKFSIMSIAAIAGPKFLNQYLLKYLSFLGPTFSVYAASFVVIAVLLAVIHFITKSTWAV